jgi:hypothetical protein
MVNIKIFKQFLILSIYLPNSNSIVNNLFIDRDFFGSRTEIGPTMGCGPSSVLQV